MALTATETAVPEAAVVGDQEVLITPCDPWPRPYYLEGGLRRVKPYHFTYNTNCKERWRGRKILDVFQDEFRDRPVEYYKSAIENGHIHINGKVIPSIDTPVKNGDIISHTLHRHEPPVTAKPIGVIYEDEQLVVIDKPAGVPVHPAGRYRFNSLVEIMRAERGAHFDPLPCNRLDRLTSGVMFIAKTKPSAAKITAQIMGRSIQKEYVARVKGEFPAEEVVCDQPVLQISPKLGLNRVRASGKEARTVFRRMAYYPSATGEGYSIVHCLPLTGRTHQIRVHLQFLGHPISNDPIYCNRRVFGRNLAKADASGDHDEDIMARLARMGKEELAEAIAYEDEMVDEYNKAKAEKLNGELCDVCGTALYSDPGAHELGIYLHAKRYADMNGEWDYSSPMPDWALPPSEAAQSKTPQPGSQSEVAHAETSTTNGSGPAIASVESSLPLAGSNAG